MYSIGQIIKQDITFSLEISPSSAIFDLIADNISLPNDHGVINL